MDASEDSDGSQVRNLAPNMDLTPIWDSQASSGYVRCTYEVPKDYGVPTSWAQPARRFQVRVLFLKCFVTNIHVI